MARRDIDFDSDLDLSVESSKEQGTGGGGGKRMLDFSGYEGVNFYKIKKGKNLIDILPFIIGTKNHPLSLSDPANVGRVTHTLSVYVHNYIGPKKASVYCLKKNQGKSCPICEMEAKLAAEGKKTESANFKAKQRCLYNVVDLTDPDKGIQIWDMSYHLFEKNLIASAQNAGVDRAVPFAHPTRGKSIAFSGEHESFAGSKPFLSPKGIVFVDRKQQYDTDVIDSVYPLDSLMQVLSYEEAEAVLYDEEMPTETKEEQQEESQPVRRIGKPAGAIARTINHDSDDQEPEENKEEQQEENTCPFGMKFGYTIQEGNKEEKDKCNNKCPGKTWDDCMEAYGKWKKANRG